MMFSIIMFGFAFAFMCLMVYCFISLISNFVFGFREWDVKRRYDNEVLKELAALPLQWKEEKLQKWYVLLAIIVCGLIWMPSFVAVIDINEVNLEKKEAASISISERYGIPEPYYSDVGGRGKNISELRTALNEIEHLQEYEANVYDCSEMSAYTEWHLENQGFNATILSNGEHAWVVVYNLMDNAPVNVECTRVPPGITNNRNYTRSYDNIYAACSRSTNTSCPAWDWWDNMPIGEIKIGG